MQKDLSIDKTELHEKKFAILQEIANTLVVTDNISALANTMLDLAINYTNAEKGSLMLVSERDELYILSARGFDPQLITTYRIKVGEGIAGTVAQSRQAFLVEDIEKDKRFKGQTRDRYKTRSFISCPILKSNRLLGVLNINDKKDDTPFTEDEFELIKIIADQAAIALENASLMKQLKEKASEVEKINKKLIESDVIKTESLIHASHELRTPLNSISGAIYYLQRSEDLSKGDQKEFFSIISQETSKLITIVEKLLDFLRLDDETRLINKSVISLPDLLNELSGSKLLEAILKNKNLKLNLDIKESISDIVADKIRLNQFFLNLVDGLSHFLDNEDTIVLTATENNHVDVSLSLPRRMPETMMPYLAASRHLFQADQPEQGLKLYLARKVAEFHRWDLSAENRGDGFVITLKIPKGTREKMEAVINTTMDLFIEFISDILGLNVCSIMLSDDLTGELSIKSARGLPEDVVKRTRIRFSDRIAGWVAQEGKPLLIENIETDPRFGRKNISQYNTKSLLSVPIKVQDRVIGVLNLNNKRNADIFTERDLSIASALSERVSHFIERLYSGEFIEQGFNQFITSFNNLLEAGKKYRKKESVFPDLMFRMLDRLGASEDDKVLGLYVSLLYDLGLSSIDESILNKKKALLQSELRSIRHHPHTTVSLLDIFEFSDRVKQAILHHHERFDGKGYPEGLKEEEIPFVSRVLSVVDAFCAMTETRPYRKKLTRDEAMKEIQGGSGTLYDPKVVESLEHIVGDR
jgi:HD-GYP domain-containing protein (c-di-GMP phosphodiesterase class II)